MTTTPEPPYGPAHYPAATPPPPMYGGGLPPTGGPVPPAGGPVPPPAGPGGHVPPALAGPGRRPPRFRKGAVALTIAGVLAAGAVGGVTGALVGGSNTASPNYTNATPVAQNVSNSPTDVSAVANKVLPSVVQVNVQLGNAEGIGSGVILTANGRVLTNNHVVGGAQQIQVVLNDGRKFTATVVGTDPASDLAVIQLQGASGLTPATLGNSDNVKIGDQVIAFGSPGGLQGTVTTGIVSALNRPVTVSEDEGQSQNPYARNRNGGASGGGQTTYQAIQTDASINQGNSGGPLTDKDGNVIGINSAIYSPVSTPDGKAGSVGIGFAIPSNTAKSVIDKIVGNG